METCIMSPPRSPTQEQTHCRVRVKHSVAVETKCSDSMPVSEILRAVEVRGCATRNDVQPPRPAWRGMAPKKAVVTRNVPSWHLAVDGLDVDGRSPGSRFCRPVREQLATGGFPNGRCLTAAKSTQICIFNTRACGRHQRHCHWHCESSWCLSPMLHVSSRRCESECFRRGITRDSAHVESSRREHLRTLSRAANRVSQCRSLSMEEGEMTEKTRTAFC